MTADLSGLRAGLYAQFDREAPEIVSRRSGWERVAPLGGREDVILVFSLSQDKASVYLKAVTPDAKSWIETRQSELAHHLRTAVGIGSKQAAKGYWFRKDNSRACFTIPSQWPEAIRWFRAQFAMFDRAVRNLEKPQ